MHPSEQRSHSHHLGPSKHVSALSQETIADSTISNGAESLRLSQFPQPPASIPSTPIRTGFGTGSPNRTTFPNRFPLATPQRKPLPALTSPAVPGPSGSSEPSQKSHDSVSPTSQRVGSATSPVSPFDWHDGASSIGNGIDATEDRLLSTSFITSLLQEKSKGGRRLSMTSDAAMSGFSEMTYPPIVSGISSNGHGYVQSSAIAQAPRIQSSGRMPPSSFIPVADPNRISGDSDTLYSREHGPSVIRTASVTRALRLPGATVVGVAPAVLQNVSPNSSSPADLDTEYPFSGAGNSAGVEPLTPNRNRSKAPTLQSRASIHSAKSSAPSFMSRVSLSRSIRRAMPWRSPKHLPPVPLIPSMPLETEMEHRRAEEIKSLPDLVQRADALEELLEKGYHPHQSLSSYAIAHKGEVLSSRFDEDTVIRDTATTVSPPVRPRRQSVHVKWPRSPDVSVSATLSFRRRRLFIFLGIFLAVVIAALGTAIGIAVSRKKKSSVSCPRGFAGAACDLNATCVCTSSLSGQCNGLAQNIVDLIPSVNQYFDTNLTGSFIYEQIRLVKGSAPGDCTPQANLVDVPPVGDPENYSNITHWARAAVLWNLVESQDLSATTSLQNFIRNAPWNFFHLASNTTSFSTTVSGYTFNFLTQQVTQPSVSFVAVGQPTAAQLSRVGTVANAALDRMYSFAQAASTQHRKALEIYWTTVLQQKLADLPTFISAFIVSPIILPFDATLSQAPQSISSLLTNSTSAFPPPLACYPRLQSSQSQQINTIETRVFNLSSVSTASQFDPTCYPDRPVYGVLDVLRLRFPFADSRPGIPRQGALLNRAVSPRVVVHNGAILSPLPGPSNVTTITSQLSDPRQYGTLRLSNHVILHYLTSIPDVNVAIALVTYVLASASMQAIPPTSDSILFRSLETIPVVEVAVFGSVLSSDVDSTITAFTTSSNTLFFGSRQGVALRNWALNACKASIAWAESALAPLIVHDSGFTDPIFEQTWRAASIALDNNVGNIGLSNVTDSFNFNHKFTPS